MGERRLSPSRLNGSLGANWLDWEADQQLRHKGCTWTGLPRPRPRGRASCDDLGRPARAAVTLVRFAWIFGSYAILELLNRAGWHAAKPLGPRAAFVMSWAGMRGVVTLAVALSLPDMMPGRDMMLVTGFAVILVAVPIQGTTLGLGIGLAGLRETERSRPPLDLFAAEATMFRAQSAEVERMAYSSDGSLLHPRLLETYGRHSPRKSLLTSRKSRKAQAGVAETADDEVGPVL